VVILQIRFLENPFLNRKFIFCSMNGLSGFSFFISAIIKDILPFSKRKRGRIW
jgi:hypothetical protein